jgi:hypothetical protein
MRQTSSVGLPARLFMPPAQWAAVAGVRLSHEKGAGFSSGALEINRLGNQPRW